MKEYIIKEYIIKEACRGNWMKAIIKKQYIDYVEHIEFPTIVYVYETGRIIAANLLAQNIIGFKLKNMNDVWLTRKKKKFSKKVLDYGSEIYYNETICNGNSLFDIDMEVNIFLMDQFHYIVCFIEHSYKQQFVKYSRIQTPRLYIKDSNLFFLGTNRFFLEDAGVEKSFRGTCNQDYLKPEISQIVDESEQLVIEEQNCTYTMVQNIKLCTVQDYFAKMSRIPLINKNGICIGMLGIYTLLLNRDEYKKLFDTMLRESSILSKAVIKSDILLLSLYEKEQKFYINYISPNFRKFGFVLKDFYYGKVQLEELFYKEDKSLVLEECMIAKRNGFGTFTKEYRLKKPDGDSMWVQCEILDVISDGTTTYWDLRLNPILKEIQVDEKSKLESSLSKAVSTGCKEFILYYQPIVDKETKETTNIEALIRWKHKDSGIVNPIDFIAVTEYMGLILPLGEYILYEVFSASVRWNYNREHKLLFHINLSLVQLVQPNIIDRIILLISKTNVDCSTIVFEVTESLAIENIELMKQILLRLKEKGFKIALDDFGKGFSSLSHITELPLDYVKIDKSFLDKYGTDEFNPSLLNSIVELVHSVNLKVIIEGVETKKQVEFLTFMGIDHYQGYYYGKPVPEEMLKC